MSDHEFVSHFDDSVRIDAGGTATEIDETTLAEMRELAGRYPDPRSALMPMLHLVQSVDGRVSDAGVRACAQILVAHHEPEGPASRWARRARPGDAVAIHVLGGTRYRAPSPSDRMLLVGDPASAPAIADAVSDSRQARPAKP